MLGRLGPIGLVRGLWRILRGRPGVPPALADNKPLQMILRRRSVRRFSAQEISDDVFAAILEAGRLAPSTVNLQTWAFSTFTPAAWRALFGAGLPFGGARAVMILGDVHRAGTVLDVFPESPLVAYTVAVMNASLAAMNMNIAAEALGVSSVMLSETGRSGFMDAGYLREKLALPDGVFPLMTIVFGLPSGVFSVMPPKLPLDQISFPGRYQEADPAVMATWLEQMRAGYKASRPSSSFEAQLLQYISKIEGAETALHAILYGDED